MKVSKCQTYPPKKWKNVLCVYYAFQGILSIFLRNLLRGWDSGRPPPVGTDSQLSPFFLKASLITLLGGQIVKPLQIVVTPLLFCQETNVRCARKLLENQSPKMKFDTLMQLNNYY